ncbi:MAG: helix-turn-helix transcriptional regulator [Candidatus Dormibacteria bacterium]
MTADIAIEGGQPKNFLRPCILLLLVEAPSHGYDLMERLAEFGFEREPGGVYRTLRGLEHDGQVVSEWETSLNGPDRRAYRLTPSGLAWLDAWVNTLTGTRNLLDLFLQRYYRHLRQGTAASRGNH